MHVKPPTVPKLDKLDWRILYELDRNASQSLAEIGKRLHVGRDVMHYRVKRLERERIIKNYITIIDYGKIGYMSGSIYLKLQHDTPEIQEEIMNYFKNDPRVWWLSFRDGNYDIALTWWAKDIVELKEAEKNLLAKYRKYFKEIKTRPYNSLTIFPRNYFINWERKKTDSFVIKTKVEKITNEDDERILALIAENARLSYVEIANKLKLSAAQVFYKLKLLREKKIILGSRAVIDCELLGYQWFKIDFYLDDFTQAEKIYSYVASHPNVVYAYDSLGGADVEFEVEVKNYDELLTIENEIKKRFGDSIRYTEHYMFFKEQKILYFPSF